MSGRTWNSAGPPRFDNPVVVERLTWGMGLLLASAAVAIGLLGLPALGVLLILLTVIAMVFVLTDRDAVTVLTSFALVLLLLPSRFVIGPLGAIGTPARVIGLAAIVWWIAGRLNPSVGGDHGQQPLRPVVLAFSWWLLLTYAFAQLRELHPVEASAADRRAIVTVALAGIALLAMDGIANRQRFDLLLRRLVALGGVMAILGLLQFFGWDLVQRVGLPGLVLNQDLSTIVGFRGGLPRVTSTAVHAIEFTVIMALLLPLAFHVAFYGSGRRWTAWLWLGAIVLALPVSVSRSSVVAIAVAVPVLAWRWSWRRRLLVLAVGAGAMAMLSASVEGLFETLTGLFQNTEEDFSIQTRLEDYEVIYQYVTERPLLGRGAGTFEPSVYFFLDNEWLMIVTTTGIPGVVLLLLLFLVAFGCCRGVLRRSTDPATRHLAQALLATMTTFAITFGLFDAFGFGINAGLFYLVVGMVGALWRVEAGSSAEGRDARGRLLPPPGPVDPLPDHLSPARRPADERLASIVGTEPDEPPGGRS